MKFLICIGTFFCTLIIEIFVVLLTGLLFGNPIGFGYGLEWLLIVFLSIKFCRLWDKYKVKKRAYKQGLTPIEYVQKQVSKGILQHFDGLRGKKRELGNAIKKYIQNGYIKKEYYLVIFEEFANIKITEQDNELNQTDLKNVDEE